MSKKKIDEILKNAEVIDKYKETKLEKIDNWLYDHCCIYAFLWRLWKNQLSPIVNYYRLKRLGQRIIWGFDDSETWALDWTFYKWLYPRLKRFEKVMQAYPTNTTFEKWKAELQKRIQQLHDILYIDEFEFKDWSYISAKELKELKAKEKKDKSDWTTTINATAYENCMNDFNKWFCKNLNQLWW